MKLNSLMVASLAGVLSMSSAFTQAQSISHDFLNITSSSSDSLIRKQQIEDQKIVGIIMTVDHNEMEAADEVKGKKVSKKVRRYAVYLHRQHAANLKALMKLVKTTGLQPSTSQISTKLTKDGQQGLSTLTALNDKTFETAYIDAMIQGHKAGLQLIDTNLLKNVTNPKLKVFVKQTRVMVAHHLQKALKIQKGL
ncbi:DUF4142 domain-containing protein [bacterium]|nr:DUF4142 domain-containing protein [bacterium]